MLTPKLKRELEDLTRRGFTYRFVDETTIELADPSTGEKRIKTLIEPSEAEIRSWANAKGIPILEIDPSLIDTSKYSGWYDLGHRISLSNVFNLPLLLADLNRNYKIEIYGRYRDTVGTPAAQIHEMDSLLIPNSIFEYSASLFPRMISDLDGDSLSEILFWSGDSALMYEQPSMTSLPSQRWFSHAMWEYSGTAIINQFKLTNLDGDTQTDFVYMGSESDSSRPSGFKYCTYVAEFDPAINNFRRVWSNYVDGGGFGGYDCGDYDTDGRMEFSCSDMQGHVWVFENQGNDSYGMSWSDSIPFRNVYGQASGDVDGDGKKELFIGASMSSGTWVIIFEPVHDNVFETQFIIRILASSLSVPTYRCVDLDADGGDDLVVLVEGLLFRFSAANNNQYSLGFFMAPSAGTGLQIADINKDGLPDLIPNGIEYTQTGIRYFAQTFFASDLVNVEEPHEVSSQQQPSLWTSPNPFNATTNVRFFLPYQTNVRIIVYSVIGEFVEEIFNGRLNEGEHSVVWSASNQSSGVYLLKMETEAQASIRKVVLLR